MNVVQKIISTLMLGAVLYANYLGTSGLLGISQAELSTLFPFNFMPPGWTFMIARGAIYLGQILFIIYLWSVKTSDEQRSKHLSNFQRRFRLSCLLNIAWIVSTGMGEYLISVGCIIGLFFVLAIMMGKMPSALSAREHLSFKIPFGLYYGWVALATRIIAISQAVFLQSEQLQALSLSTGRTRAVVGLGVFVASYSWVTWKNIGQFLISLLAFAGIASALYTAFL